MKISSSSAKILSAKIDQWFCCGFCLTCQSSHILRFKGARWSNSEKKKRECESWRELETLWDEFMRWVIYEMSWSIVGRENDIGTENWKKKQNVTDKINQIRNEEYYLRIL